MRMLYRVFPKPLCSDLSEYVEKPRIRYNFEFVKAGKKASFFTYFQHAGFYNYSGRELNTFDVCYLLFVVCLSPFVCIFPF